jgi:hypothetical protein
MPEIKAGQLKPGERFRFAKYKTGRRPALLMRLAGDVLIHKFSKPTHLPVCNLKTGVTFLLNKGFPVMREKELHESAGQ